MNKLLTALALLIVILLGFRFLRGTQGVQIGNVAPEIEAILLNGEEFQLSQLRGNYVLIDFWGSWCGPCRRENPSLVKLYRDFETVKSKNGEGFEILSISLEKTEGRAEQAILRDNLYWKNHIVAISRVVMLSSLANKYKVTSIPTKFLLNPDGKIMSINPNAEEIRDILNKYLL